MTRSFHKSVSSASGLIAVTLARLWGTAHTNCQLYAAILNGELNFCCTSVSPFILYLTLYAVSTLSHHRIRELQKETPHHSYTNATGAVKTSPIKIKKEGHAGKGSWGSQQDEIQDAKHVLNDGDLPPVSSPERDKSMRKLSISSSNSLDTVNSNASNGSGPFVVPGLTNAANGKQAEKIVEEMSEWVNEPAKV